MDIRVPHLADGVESGTVVNVLVNIGDMVKKDQTLVELETEKAVAAIPAPADGTVTRISVKRDDKVAVGQVIISISEGAKAAGNGHSAPVAAPTPASAAPRSPQPVAAVSTHAAPAAVPQRRPLPAGIPEAASPTVRRVAMEIGIDLSRVAGSERGGRVVMDDIRAYVQNLQSLVDAGVPAAVPAAASSPAPAVQRVELPDFSKWGAIEAKPMSSLRKKISEKMSESAHSVARVTQFDEIDITDLMALKKKYDESFAKQGTKLTMSTFAVKVVVDALKKHPVFNSSLDLANEKIIYKNYFHVAMAVDTEHGLIVPVIKDADKKNLVEISKEIDRLAAATRERKISGDDLQGGTFTISNQGSLGGTHFTPVVYTPQVAILGLGRARWSAVVRDGKIVSRLIMPTALSYDHRVIDGGNAVRFNNDLVKGFQEFDESALASGKAAAAKPQLQKAKKK